MTNTNPLDSLKRRAVRHAFEDGTIDIVLGVFTLMVGSATQRRMLFALSAVYLALMAQGWKGLHIALTSRRTGYAEAPGNPPGALLAVVLLAACLTMGVVAGLTFTGGRLWAFDYWPDWSPMLSGTALASGFVYTASQTGLARYYVFTAIALGTSLFFWLFPFGPRINPSDRLTLSLFLLAGVLIVAGGLTIARFVRTHPVVAEEVGDVR